MTTDLHHRMRVAAQAMATASQQRELHPRERRPANVGTDLLSLIWSLGMFAWVAVLLYG